MGKKDPEDKHCCYLLWDGGKWRCELILRSKTIGKALYAGEGCCADLNTYFRYKIVPTPKDLANENAFLCDLKKRRKK
jgi:hypothetical protein